MFLKLIQLIFNKAVLILLCILIMLFVGCWGSHTFEIIFENQTEQKLTIYLETKRVGNIESGKQITQPDVSWDYGKYLVIAKNEKGEKVFSQIFTTDQMQQIKAGYIYKIIISTLTKIPESSDNVPSDNITAR